MVGKATNTPTVPELNNLCLKQLIWQLWKNNSG